MSEQMRLEFEAAFPVPVGVAWSAEHQNYGWVKKQAFQRTVTYRALWTGWKASRAALVIELPAALFCDDHHTGDIEVYEAPVVRSRLKAAGVSFKP